VRYGARLQSVPLHLSDRLLSWFHYGRNLFSKLIIYPIDDGVREKMQFVAPDGVLEAHATMYSCE